jgi:uncharacterized protein YllA (UPF0747 family)
MDSLYYDVKVNPQHYLYSMFNINEQINQLNSKIIDENEKIIEQNKKIVKKNEKIVNKNELVKIKKLKPLNKLFHVLRYLKLDIS